MRALTTAATGMAAQQTRLDTIANNLANVSTTGFKKSRDAFQDLFYQQLAAGGAGPTGSVLQLGGGTRIAGIERDQAQGALVATGNPLHVALQGDGWFVVETPDGVPSYTRDGTFSTDADGQLVTTAGLTVAGDIRIPDGAGPVVIDADGTVHVTMADDPSRDVVLGQLEVVRFTNSAGLLALGGNRFQATPASGDPLELDEASGVQVVQGYLEGSNVDVATELVDMIAAQRIYEMNSKVIQAADEALQIAANLRR